MVRGVLEQDKPVHPSGTPAKLGLQTRWINAPRVTADPVAEGSKPTCTQTAVSVMRPNIGS